MTIDVTNKEIGAAFLGCASAFLFVMMTPLTHYELYGEFLITFALSLIGLWWYPIYTRERGDA